jgi:hypothetical protein
MVTYEVTVALIATRYCVGAPFGGRGLLGRLREPFSPKNTAIAYAARTPAALIA